MINNDTYIHPMSDEIGNIIKELKLESMPLKKMIETLFCWFDNYNYKNTSGESLNEVKERMFYTMQHVIEHTRAGEVSLVISHAAAICSHLLNFCNIDVTDVATKSRCGLQCGGP